MKVFEGIIVSIGMNKTVVVEVTRRTPHPLYKKLIKRSKKYKVDSGDKTLFVGNVVKIAETRPISKGKYFKILEVIGMTEIVAKSERPVKLEEPKIKEEKVENISSVEVKKPVRIKVKAVKKESK